MAKDATRNASGAANGLTVVQCWDDGVVTDVRLIEILRRHGAKATFNLCAGLHTRQRHLAWQYKETPVWRLGWDEMQAVYAGFTIANHSLTHPHLEQLPPAAAQREIAEGRERLQQFFGQAVPGFVYPFGTYNPAVCAAVRAAGHVYARTTGRSARPCPPADPMVFHPSSHFLAPDLWAQLEQSRPSGVFYFWGHSYEMVNDQLWAAFENFVARVSADPGARWGEIADLFAATPPAGSAP